MAQKKTSPVEKTNFKRYKDENRWLKNKTRKLEKHRKNHPDDDTCLQALNVARRGDSKYTRRRPFSKGINVNKLPKKVKAGKAVETLSFGEIVASLYGITIKPRRVRK